MRIFQIYYDDKSYKNCLVDHRVTRIHNTDKPQPYFENDVIRKIVPVISHDRIGIFSHKYTHKLGIPLDKIEQREEDVITFFALNYKNHYWKNFERWHPNGLKALEVLKNEFKWNIDFKKQPKHIVYQNHFVAKSEVYKHYVKDYLIPVMDYLDKHPELVNFEPNLPKYQGYTMHTFLLERLFTIFLELNNYTVHQFNILHDKN